MSDAGVPDEIREAIEAERKLDELQSAVARSRALQLEVLLARRSPGVVVIVGLLVLALIGLADAASGGFAFEVFYLVPIGLVTFGRGRGMGLLVSAVAVVAWGAVEVFQGVTSVHALVTYWNGFARFLGYAGVALLIAPLREAMVLQRQLAEQEGEAVEQMRAMEELREAALHSGLPEAAAIIDHEPAVDASEGRDQDASVAEAHPAEVIPVEDIPAEDIPAEDVPAEVIPADVVATTEGPPSDDQERLLGALSDLERDARRERRTKSEA